MSVGPIIAHEVLGFSLITIPLKFGSTYMSMHERKCAVAKNGQHLENVLDMTYRKHFARRVFSQGMSFKA